MITGSRAERIAFVGWLLFVFALAWPSSALAESPTRWTHTAGPAGGIVYALAQDPRHPDTLFAGTSNGIYKSTDAGIQWLPIAQAEFACRAVTQLAIDPADSRVIYAGTNDGLLQSTDGGASWESLLLGTTHDVILSLAVHSEHTRLLYVGAGGTVWRSVDRGGHWQSAEEGAPSFAAHCLALHPWNPNIVYAGADDGVYVTTDGGGKWHRTADGLPISTQVQALAVDPQNPLRLYAGTSAGLYISQDGGNNWKVLGQEGRPDSASAILIDKKDHRLYVSSTHGGFYQSTDGGESWASLGKLETGLPILSLVMQAANPRRFYAGTASGIWASADGGIHWRRSDAGITASQVLRMVDVQGTRGQLYAVTYRGLYRTLDGGGSWQALSEGQNFSITGIATDPGNAHSLYVNTDQGFLYHSADSGQSWVMIAAPPVSAPRYTGLAVSRSDTGPMLYAALEESGIWAYRDSDAAWGRLPEGLPPVPVKTLAVGERFLYIGVQNILYRLAMDDPDAEATWEPVISRPLDGQISGLFVEAGENDTLYIATDAGAIYRGLGNGSDWVNLFQGAWANKMVVRSLAVMQGGPRSSILYVVTDVGVLYSQDRGKTWLLDNSACIQNGLASCVATDDGMPGVVYIGTDGAGIIRGNYTGGRLAPPISPWALVVPMMVAASGAGAFFWWRRRRAAPRQAQTALDKPGFPDDNVSDALFQHNRVVPEMLISVPETARVAVMRRYVDAHKNLDLIFHEDPPAIEPAKHWRLQHFTDSWDALLSRARNISAATPVAARITEQLCDLLGFTPLENKTFRSLFGYKIKAPAIRLSLPPEFPIIFVLERHLREGTEASVRDFLQVLNVTSFFAILIVVDEDVNRRERGPELQRLVRGGADDFIVLDYQDIHSLFLSRDPERQLVDLILRQVDLTVVSPYVVSGPVLEKMFFGRDYELKAIMRAIHDHNFAIVGGRKIGKTSVLNKVYRLMEQTSGFAPYYLDCQHVVNYEGFFSELAVRCQVPIESASPDIMRRVILRLRRQGSGRLILLLDEVDRLLAFDLQQQMHLFRVFRALAQEGLCHLVCCGERQLDAALHDAQSPLFNLANIIHLTYLTPRDARRIVEEPMAAMGVSFEDPEVLPQSIVDLSSCHPNLVQMICQMLVMRVNARGDRMIRADDLARVRSSDEFKDFFLEVTWGNATDLERLISLCMIGQADFTLAEVSQALLERGARAPASTVERALDGLVLFSILRRQGERYTYAARSFPTLVAESQLAAGLEEGLIAKLRSGTARGVK